MAGGRAREYGRHLAEWVNHTISHIHGVRGVIYRAKLVEELRKGLRDSRELKSTAQIDIDNPEHLAGLIREGIRLGRLGYQKATASRVLNSLLENL